MMNIATNVTDYIHIVVVKYRTISKLAYWCFKCVDVCWTCYHCRTTLQL